MGELRLVREEDRPIEYCPLARREDHRRALMAVLEDIDVAVMRAHRRALEGRFDGVALAIAGVRVVTRKLVEMTREAE